MKTLKELKNINRKQVKIWLSEWIEHAEKKMVVPQDNMARKLDFKNDDVFYFTHCADIIKNEPNCKDEVTVRKIYQRKSWHMLKLFLQYLIDDFSDVAEGWKHCAHCGYDACELRSLNGFGHYNYCPNCKRVAITLYKDTMDDAIAALKSELVK